MKKLTALFLVLAMVIASVSAMAANSSINNGNLNTITVEGDNEAVYLFPVNEPTVGESLANYQRLLDIAQVEIEKLAGMEIVDYFANANVDLAEKVGVPAEELNVFEFSPVVAGNFDEDYGPVVVANMLFATPYEVGQEVQAMIGIVTLHEDGTQTVEWTAYDAIGVENQTVENYGTLKASFDLEKVLEVQEGVALLAIVSK